MKQIRDHSVDRERWWHFRAFPVGHHLLAIRSEDDGSIPKPRLLGVAVSYAKSYVDAVTLGGLADGLDRLVKFLLARRFARYFRPEQSVLGKHHQSTAGVTRFGNEPQHFCAILVDRFFNDCLNHGQLDRTGRGGRRRRQVVVPSDRRQAHELKCAMHEAILAETPAVTKRLWRTAVDK